MGKDLDRENDLLATELGYEQGKPRYQWRFSENLYMPMRDKDGKYNYIANPATGIIEAQPVFVQRKMTPHLHRQWVMCKWLDPGPEATWREIFGSWVEYPLNGYYAPTNIELDEGISPWDTNEGKSVTYWFLAVARKDAAKTLEDLKAEGDAIVARQEKRRDDQLDEIIGESLLPFGIVPGTRSGGVSLPSAASTAAHDRVFKESSQ